MLLAQKHRSKRWDIGYAATFAVAVVFAIIAVVCAIVAVAMAVATVRASMCMQSFECCSAFESGTLFYEAPCWVERERECCASRGVSCCPPIVKWPAQWCNNYIWTAYHDVG